MTNEKNAEANWISDWQSKEVEARFEQLVSSKEQICGQNDFSMENFKYMLRIEYVELIFQPVSEHLIA